MNQKYKNVVVILCFLFVVVGSVHNLWNNRHKYAATLYVNDSSAQTTADVLSLEYYNARKESNRYKITYTFEVDRKVYTGNDEIRALGYAFPKKVAVKYYPNNPAHSKLVGSYYSVGLVISDLLILVALIPASVLIVIYMHKPTKKLLTTVLILFAVLMVAALTRLLLQP